MDTSVFSSCSSNSNSSLIVDHNDLIDMRITSSSSASGTMITAKKIQSVRVLLVDDNPVCLSVILRMLKMFDYEAVGARGGLEGLKLLREKPCHFDLVVSAIHMPRINGFELLRRIKLEFATLPVILVSNSADIAMAAKEISNSASYFLHKPITYSAVENMWQYVHKGKVSQQGVSKNTNKKKSESSVEQDSSREKEKKKSIISGSLSSDDEGNSRFESRKRKEPCNDKRNRTRANKTPRVVWTAQLHTHFLNAIERLGVDNAVPKKILEYMRVPGLTRENVASHLQKYRIFVKGIVERNQIMEPNIAKFLTNGAFLSNFASDMPATNMQHTDAPQQSFTPCRSGITTGDFQGFNTDQTSISHCGVSTLNTSPFDSYNNGSFQFGQSSMLPNDNNQEFIAPSTKQPWSINNRNHNVVRVGTSQSNNKTSISGGKSGKGTMAMVLRQNIVRWRSNVQGTAGPLLNFGTHSMINQFDFERQNNAEMVRNKRTLENIGSSSVGSFSQALTPNNFTGLQILNNNTNSLDTLHVGPVSHNLLNDSNYGCNLDFNYINKPTSISSVMEVSNQMPQFPNMASVTAIEGTPNFVLESPGGLSSISAIEAWNLSDKYYQDDQFSTVGLEEVSEAMKVSAITQDEASFAGRIFNTDTDPQQEKADPTTLVLVPALEALKVAEVEQAMEEEGDTFDGLFDISRINSNFGMDLYPSLLDGEDFTDFLGNSEQSTSHQGGTFYDGENLIDPRFDISMYQVDPDDDIFQF